MIRGLLVGAVMIVGCACLAVVSLNGQVRFLENTARSMGVRPSWAPAAAAAVGVPDFVDVGPLSATRGPDVNDVV